jgi:feruloyl esterase
MTTFVLALIAAVVVGQGQRGGRGAPGAPGAPAGPAVAGRGAPQAPAPKALIANAKPMRTCESLATVALPNTTIESAAVDPNNSTLCRITAFTTHPPAGDKVRIWLAIPLSNWNGRFMGTGGGGFSGGNVGGVNGPAAQGYAAGATDTGHEGGSGSFALGADGKHNWQLIRDNGHVGIHEMTVTGKALAEALYGVAPRYSYFNGCSTGGRQGQMEAQRYPQDYNGIMSGSPAINWQKLHPQQMWGAMLMNVEGNAMPQCKIAAATAAVIAACDAIDGVKDGVIEDPMRCTYDPKALVGTSAGECGAFTQADADLIRKLWDGPRRKDGSFLWYGLPRGADLTALWTSRGTPPQPQAFGISLEWFRYFLTQNAQFDWKTITPDMYERLFDQSVEEFTAVIGTDNPDLTEFRTRGGKTILWHGWSDQLISAEGTVDYYNRVAQTMGGADKTSQFMRLFMAPGVGHCGGGAGPSPTGQVEALLAWVEEGKAPETLLASRPAQGGGTPRTRPLCRYPLVAKYKGSGSTDDAVNFVCSAGF